MKRLILLILCLCFCFSVGAASPATPTDLEEFDDDDWGTLSVTLERQVYISIDKEPEYYGDVVTLTVVLVNFNDDDKVTFSWQYAIDLPDWMFIENEHEQTYTFILDKTNYLYWYRVMVELEGESI